jgi:hypothetical protein
VTTPAVERLPYPVRGGSRIPLLLFGVREGHREVVLHDDVVESRFGFFTVAIPVTDIERWDITGPYRWIRAIGVRNTLFHKDISFCADASGAIRLWLRTPRRIGWVRGVNEVFLGVEDPARLGAWLAERGVTGEDLRGR